MLHVGLDLSRHRLDVCVLEPGGAVVEQSAVAPEGEELPRWQRVSRRRDRYGR
jgi:hypothetical protein